MSADSTTEAPPRKLFPKALTAAWDAHMASFERDIRYGARTLLRHPALAIAALITIALGVGANTAMFSVVRAVRLRPLPYAEPSRLAVLWTEDAARGLREQPTAYRTIADWKSASPAFSDVEFYSVATASLRDEIAIDRVRSAFVSGNLFRVLGVRPAVGRWIGADDFAERRNVAVISYALWQRRFGGDSAAIGRTLELESDSKESIASPLIVGVMPASFYFPDKQTQFWVPATTYWRWERESSERFQSWARRWSVVARLRAGATFDEARRELLASGRRLELDYPATVPDFPGYAPRLVPIHEQVTGRSLRFALWLLLGAVGFVLLIACANVANLLLARGAARQHEFAVRAAFGAARPRLMRQLLIESTIMALAGGAIGVIIAAMATKGLGFAASLQIPRLDEVRIDASVLGFAALTSLLAGLLFGIAPALKLSGVRPIESIKAGSPAGNQSGNRTRATLVVVECALALVLLAGAGVLVRSFIRLQSVDPGFRPEGVLSMRLTLPAMENAEPVARELVTRIAQIAGVRGASMADGLLIRGEPDESITIPGRDMATLGAGQLYTSSVTPGFFQMMGVPLRTGRYFGQTDVDAKRRTLLADGREFTEMRNANQAPAEPVIVNEAFVRRFYPNENPVGRRFCIDPTGRTYWYQIVGVVGDMRRQGLERDPVPEYFQTFLPRVTAELLVRTDAPPLAAAASVRNVVTQIFPGVRIDEVTTAERRLGAPGAQRRFQTTLLTLFAVLALVLAAVGIYGIVHYAVAERRRELGVRIALGASGADVMRMIVRRGMLLPLIGIAIGLVGALALSRVMSSMVFGVTASDPTTLVAVAALLSAVAMVACFFPAMRAARIDPVIALRQD